MCLKKYVCNRIWIRVAIVFLSDFLTPANTEDCGQEEWALCAKPLQLFSPTSELSFVIKKEELEKLCPDLHFGLNCIRSYTRRCMNIHQREHFNKLYHGTSQVIHEICENGPHQEDFLRHAPCMRHVKRDYEICSNQYQQKIAEIGQSSSTSSSSSSSSSSSDAEQHVNLTQLLADEEEKRREICCSFTEYIDCSERVVRHACGYETANYTRKFLDKMSSSIISMHCEDYRNNTKKCSDQHSSATGILSNFHFVLLLIGILNLKILLLKLLTTSFLVGC